MSMPIDLARRFIYIPHVAQLLWRLLHVERHFITVEIAQDNDITWGQRNGRRTLGFLPLMYFARAFWNFYCPRPSLFPIT